MAAASRTTLKTYFETADVPNQTEFSELIDSFFNSVDDSAIAVNSITDKSGGITTIGNAVDVTGKITGSSLKVITGAAAGRMLISNASGDLGYLAAGSTSQILVGGGAANPVWTSATGSGAPVRAGSPALTGTASAVNLNMSGLLKVNTIEDYSGHVTTINNNTAIVGSGTVSADLGSPSFASGLAGSGWRYDASEDTLTVGNLTVRNRLRSYEILVEQVRGSRGSLVVSPGSAIIAGVSGSTATVDTGDDGRFPISLVENDIIRCQRFSGNVTTKPSKYYLATVDSVTGSNFTFTVIDGTDSVEVGDEVVVYGNTTDTDRQGLIYITSSDSGAPYIDVLDEVDSASITGKQKARLGNLAGITDPVLGALTGYGLYADNVYLRGKIVVQAGSSGIANLSDAGNLATQDRGDLDFTDGADQTSTVIAGGLITSGRIELGSSTTINAGISGAGTSDAEVRIWAGDTYDNRDSAPFRVLQDGSFIASKGTLQSSSSGKRIEIDGVNNNLKLYNTVNNRVILIDEGSYLASGASVEVGGYVGSASGSSILGEGSLILNDFAAGFTKSLNIDHSTSDASWPTFGVDVNIAPGPSGTGGNLYGYRAKLSNSGGRYGEFAYGYASEITSTEGINYGVNSKVTGVGAAVNVGIRAEASGAEQNYAGVFVGDVTVSENLSVSGDLSVAGAVNGSLGVEGGLYSFRGTGPGSATNRWQKILSFDYTAYTANAFTLKVVFSGLNPINHVIVDVHFGYKNQNGTHQTHARIVNYGVNNLLYTQFSVRLDETNERIILYAQIVNAYMVPDYTIIGSKNVNPTWYGTILSSLSGEPDDTWDSYFVDDYKGYVTL